MDQFDIWAAEIQQEAAAADATVRLKHEQESDDREWRRWLEGETISLAEPRVEKKFAKSATTARSEKTPSGAVCDYDAEGNLIRCRCEGVSIEAFDLDKARAASCRCAD